MGTTVYTDDGTSIPGISFTSSITYSALLASEKNMDTYDDLFIEGSTGNIINENNLIIDPTVTSSADKWVFEFQCLILVQSKQPQLVPYTLVIGKILIKTGGIKIQMDMIILNILALLLAMEA